MTTMFKMTKTTMDELRIEYDKSEKVEQPATIILENPKEKRVIFRCSHCGAKFSTTEWVRTRNRHYSASCPCCPYRAWAR